MEKSLSNSTDHSIRHKSIEADYKNTILYTIHNYFMETIHFYEYSIQMADSDKKTYTAGQNCFSS